MRLVQGSRLETRPTACDHARRPGAEAPIRAKHHESTKRLEKREDMKAESEDLALQVQAQLTIKFEVANEGYRGFDVLHGAPSQARAAS